MARECREASNNAVFLDNGPRGSVGGALEVGALSRVHGHLCPSAGGCSMAMEIGDSNRNVDAVGTREGN